MASALLRSTPALRAGLRARSTPLAAMATTSFVRNKATLPDLPCTFSHTLTIFDIHS
jgi:superoxide dismutase, Fe-Mn family